MWICHFLLPKKNLVGKGAALPSLAMVNVTSLAPDSTLMLMENSRASQGLVLPESKDPLTLIGIDSISAANRGRSSIPSLLRLACRKSIASFQSSFELTPIVNSLVLPISPGVGSRLPHSSSAMGSALDQSRDLLMAARL